MFDSDAAIINENGFLELARRDHECLAIINGEPPKVRRYTDEELAPRIEELKKIRAEYQAKYGEEGERLNAEARAERSREIRDHAEDMATYGKRSS